MPPPPPARKAPLPRHADPAVERLSYAPYNFVPLPEAVLPARPEGDPSPKPWENHGRYLPGTLTGWIDLTITAATPLFVRCAPPVEHAKDPEPRTNRHRQDFFHLGDPEKPALPGSTLRGMARALFEIVSFARMAPGLHFSDRRLVYRAIGDLTSLGVAYRDAVLGPNQDRPPRMKFEYPTFNLRAGYLRQKDSQWFIQPAFAINGESFVHVEYKAARCGRHEPHFDYRNNDVIDVYLRPPPGRSTPPRSNSALVLNLAVVSDPADVVKVRGKTEKPEGFVAAKVVRSGHSDGPPEKHMHCAVYEPDPSAAWLPIATEAWQTYEQDRDQPRGFPARPLQEDGDPCFYLVDDAGQIRFLGPTMLFRLPYPWSLKHFVPAHLREGDPLDLAEAVFGTVHDGVAVKGRVFFEDAPWDGLGGTPFLQPGEAGRRTPFILGNPKPTAFQHYLTQPLVDLPDGQPKPAGQDKQTLCHYHHPYGQASHTLKDANDRPLAVTDGTLLRGHKRYWHQPNADDRYRFQKALARPDETAFTIIRPVRPTTTFKGRVRFENLTDIELGALLTVLQLKPSQRHHLGMGKPLGLGSVRIETTVHVTERQARYATLFGADGRMTTGAIAAAEVDKVATRARSAFESTVIAHYRNAVGLAGPLKDVWAIPRLRALSALLEWDRAPLLERTGYAPPGVKEDDLIWWRDRRVLPTAELVAGIETVEPQPRPPRDEPAGLPRRDKPGGSSERREEREGAARRGKPSGPPKERDRDRPGRREPARPRAAFYETGKAVLCVLLEDKTKAGNWKAAIKDTEIRGDVMGSAPADAEAGKEVSLVVRFFTPPQSASFWWPESVPKPKTSGRGGSPRG